MSANENETFTDIISEIRAAAPFQACPKLVMRLADRLEAAAKRERNNAAAMREALLRCEAISHLPEIRDQQCVKDMRNIVQHALSAPLKNCDRFNSVKDAAIAFARERQNAPHPCPDFTFSAWLFAQAKSETKGENNGK